MLPFPLLIKISMYQNSNIMRSRMLVLLFALSLVLSSCWDVADYENVVIEPVEVSYSFPLINSQITLMDLLESTSTDTTFFIEVRNDSIILRFTENLLFELDIVLPDNLFNKTIPVIPLSSEVFYDGYTTIENESEIKSIDFRAGELWVEFEKDFAENVDVNLDISSLIVNENDDTYNVSADWNSDPFLSRHTFDLSQKHLNLFRLEGLDTLYNNLSYGVTLGETTGAGNLTIRLGFTELEYSKITGDIHYLEDFTTQEIELDLFSMISDGEIHLTDPTLEFIVSTSIGTPLALLFNEIRFEKDGQDPMFLENVGTEGNPLIIGQPNFIPFATDEDPFVTASYELNSQNSTIDQILPYSPNKIFFTGGYEIGDIDPEAQFDYTHDFFLYDTSTVAIDLNMEVPLTGRIQDLKLSHEVEEISFPKIDEIDGFNIDNYNVTMFFKTENAIPLTFSMQAVFKSDLGVSLDTLFSNVEAEDIIKSPSIDANGDPIGTYELLTRISMPMDKYDKISDATNAELIFIVNTGDETQNEVNIKASQFLTVIISVAFNADVAPDM